MDVVQLTKNGFKVLTPREVEYATAKRNLGSNLTKWACKVKGQTLDEFYQETMDKHNFDDFGRFEDFFETGLERMIWTVYDERLKGYKGMKIMEVDDEVVLFDWAGNQIRDSVVLTEEHLPWQEFGEMCDTLKIKPQNVFKSLYMMGIHRGGEYPGWRDVWKDNPGFLNDNFYKKIKIENYDKVQGQVKKWFYKENDMFNGEKPIDVYKREGIQPIVDLLDKAFDWSLVHR